MNKKNTQKGKSSKVRFTYWVEKELIDFIKKYAIDKNTSANDIIDKQLRALYEANKPVKKTIKKSMHKDKKEAMNSPNIDESILDSDSLQKSNSFVTE